MWNLEVGWVGQKPRESSELLFDSELAGSRDIREGRRYTKPDRTDTESIYTR